jgi:hypothetical protein
VTFDGDLDPTDPKVQNINVSLVVGGSVLQTALTNATGGFSFT